MVLPCRHGQGLSTGKVHWPWLDHLEPRKRPWNVFRFISHKFEAKLHQEGNDVTAADEYWLVAIGKFSHRVDSLGAVFLVA